MKYALSIVILFMSSCFAASSMNIDQAKEIVFGQTGDFSGSMHLYGKTIRDGINAYFTRVNQQGGIQGKTLRLMSMDDKGSLKHARNNIARMRQQGITMFLGLTSTDTVLSVLPDVRRGDISVLFPWSGSPLLRDGKIQGLVNGPGLMDNQLTTLINYLVNVLGHKRVAIFHSDDAFSRNVAHHASELLLERGIKPLTTVYYNRSTLAITDPARRLRDVDPRAILCIGTSDPAIKLINNFFEQGHYATTFLGIDSTLFVGEKLQGKGVPFYYTSAVPDPKTSNLLLAQHYLQDIARSCPDETPNVLSFTYYLSAAIVVDALKSVDDHRDGRAVIQEIESMHDHAIEEYKITFDAATRHAYGSDVSLIKG